MEESMTEPSVAELGPETVVPKSVEEDTRVGLSSLEPLVPRTTSDIPTILRVETYLEKVSGTVHPDSSQQFVVWRDASLVYGDIDVSKAENEESLRMSRMKAALAAVDRAAVLVSGSLSKSEIDNTNVMGYTKGPSRYNGIDWLKSISVEELNAIDYVGKIRELVQVKALPKKAKLTDRTDVSYETHKNVPVFCTKHDLDRAKFDSDTLLRLRFEKSDSYKEFLTIMLSRTNFMLDVGKVSQTFSIDHDWIPSQKGSNALEKFLMNDINVGFGDYVASLSKPFFSTIVGASTMHSITGMELSASLRINFNTNTDEKSLVGMLTADRARRAFSTIMDLYVHGRANKVHFSFGLEYSALTHFHAILILCIVPGESHTPESKRMLRNVIADLINTASTNKHTLDFSSSIDHLAGVIATSNLPETRGGEFRDFFGNDEYANGANFAIGGPSVVMIPEACRPFVVRSTPEGYIPAGGRTVAPGAPFDNVALRVARLLGKILGRTAAGKPLEQTLYRMIDRFAMFYFKKIWPIQDVASMMPTMFPYTPKMKTFPSHAIHPLATSDIFAMVGLVEPSNLAITRDTVSLFSKYQSPNRRMEEFISNYAIVSEEYGAFPPSHPMNDAKVIFNDAFDMTVNKIEILEQLRNSQLPTFLSSGNVYVPKPSDVLGFVDYRRILYDYHKKTIQDLLDTGAFMIAKRFYKATDHRIRLEIDPNKSLSRIVQYAPTYKEVDPGVGRASPMIISRHTIAAARGNAESFSKRVFDALTTGDGLRIDEMIHYNVTFSRQGSQFISGPAPVLFPAVGRPFEVTVEAAIQLVFKGERVSELLYRSLDFTAPRTVLDASILDRFVVYNYDDLVKNFKREIPLLREIPLDVNTIIEVIPRAADLVFRDSVL